MAQNCTISDVAPEVLQLETALMHTLGYSADFLTYPVNLSESNLYDTISIERLETLLKGAKDKMNRKEILSKHKPEIKQLPSGKWYTRIDGKKVERVNKKDLEDLVLEFYKVKEVTLSSIFENYLFCRKRDVADTTWQKDIRYYESFIKDSPIAEIPLSKLSLDDGYRFLDHCLAVKPGMKRKYWNNIIGCINQMFQYALDRNLMERNPFEHLNPKKDLFGEEKKTRDGDTVFSKAEQTRVIALAEADAEYTMKSEALGIVLLFNLGIRDGELCAIKWGDVEENFRSKYIHIQREMVANVDENGKAHGFKVLPHCKTPAGDRRLLLNSKAVDTLKRIKVLNQENGIPTGEGDYIFMRMEKGNLLNCTPRSFDPRLRKYCKQAGMEVIKSPHDVRRTVLTNLYMARMPLKKIQEFAGHSSLKQTMDYIRITDDDMDMMQYLDTLSEEATDTVIPFRKNA